MITLIMVETLVPNPNPNAVEALMHTAVLGKRKIVFDPMPIVEGIKKIGDAGGRAVLATAAKSWRGRTRVAAGAKACSSCCRQSQSSLRR